jgi:RimJ/RimL family protein N-acetyltransferase
MILKNFYFYLTYSYIFTFKTTSLNMEKIIISPLTMKDKQKYKEISTDPRILEQNISSEKSMENNYFESNFKYKLREEDPLKKVYCIFIDGKLVGYIGFFKDVKTPKTLFLYYAIHQKEWGKGIATVAVKKFIQEFMGLLKVNSINLIKATVKIQNIGSQKVLLKNGFKPKKDENGDLSIEYIDGQSVVYTYSLIIK